ncbi:trypsin-like peptidase domain-containing protein [bacterium]|nr:trypsin-like peptidase domain-containing protein [bacterium]
MRHRLLLFIVLLLGLAISAYSLPVLGNEEEQRIQAIERAQKSVVSVRTYRKNQDKPGIGSGVVIRSDGYIVTNAHVIKNAANIKVQLSNKKIFNASVYQTAKDSDLALLRINTTGLHPATLGNPDNVRVGQTVIAIGDPLGFTGTVTIGMVSSLHRNVETKGIQYKDLIQTDAAINPGSSGGGMFNLKGQLIGINALVYNGPANGYDKAQGLAFAIPVSTLRRVAKDILGSAPASSEEAPKPSASSGGDSAAPAPSAPQHRSGGRAWLGISGKNLTPQTAIDYNIKIKTGVLVVDAAEGSPAKRAKLRSGDAISAINGQTVTSTKDMVKILEKCHPGDTILMNVWRGDKMFTIKITLEAQGG